MNSTIKALLTFKKYYNNFFFFNLTESYYNEWVVPQEHGILRPLAGKPICRQCHPRCKNCTGYGFHEQVCQKCAIYKLGEQCEDECPTDHFVDDEHSECLPCFHECRGCFGSGADKCFQCATLKIFNGDPYDNSTTFNCTSTCPTTHPFTIYPHDQIGPYCSSVAPATGFLADSGETPAILMGTLFGLVVMVFVCVLVMYYYYQKIKAKKEKLKMAIGIDLMHCAADSVSLRTSDVGPNLTQLRIIKLEELRISGPLGMGEFAAVYKGTWTPQNQTRKNIVAIKILKKMTGPESSKEFLEEASIMATLEHPNLLKLQAICMTSQIMLITQIMTNGSSLQYVRTEKEKTGSKNLLNWCTQIARGMSYLEERRLVHRDLAARNVLVDNNKNVKIADFGLAKILSNDSDEYVPDGGKMPIKWLALECIQNRIFTSKSDVWAFGITTWELLTFGRRPYDDTATADIPALIESGQRLECPPYCSVEIFKTLLWCWHKRSSLRPTFNDLVEEFSKFASDPGRYLCIPGDKYQRAPLYTGQNVDDIIKSLPNINDTDLSVDLVDDGGATAIMGVTSTAMSSPPPQYQNSSQFQFPSSKELAAARRNFNLDADDYLIPSSQSSHSQQMLSSPAPPPSSPLSLALTIASSNSGKACYVDFGTGNGIVNGSICGSINGGAAGTICIDNPEYLIGSVINYAAPAPTQTIGIPIDEHTRKSSQKSVINKMPSNSSDVIETTSDHEYYNDLQRELQPLHREGGETTV